MKLAIIGSRNFNNYDLLKSTITKYFSNPNGYTFNMIVSGGTLGADSLAIKYAKEYLIDWKEFPAEWYNLDLLPCKIKLDKNGKKYNCLAGFNRNSSIIKESDLILAFWDGKSKGTQDSLKKAKESKKPTFIINEQ